MAFRVYNTLSRQIEEFKPLEGNQVRMYTCGPTVYDYAHIGNYRTFIFQDVLRRFLKYRGYEVIQVMNLTDVDDKTIRNARTAGLGLREYTTRFIEAFEVDRQLLNLEQPEHMVRATDHIDDMVKLIQILIEKGYAYRSDGSIYFRVDKFKDYGKLSKIDLTATRPGARVDTDEYDKADVRDFVLWKSAKEGEPSWETPIGRGRPGWHIECSVMSMKYLGAPFDIHSGGSDLIFPHHENEIAQSEAATGKMFAHYWLHAEHLVVNGERMGKSLGNFFTLRDLIAKGYKPTAIRYLLSSVPYRRPLNFTFEGLHQAQQSLDRLRNFRYRLTMEKFSSGESENFRARTQDARQDFDDALDDNLNVAEALAAVFTLVRDVNSAMDSGHFHDGDRAPVLDLLERWDRVFAVLEDNDYPKLRQFGFVKAESARETGPSKKEQTERGKGPEQGQGYTGAVLVEAISNEEIEKKIAERDSVRRKGNFARADQIRDELSKVGVLIEDTKAGTRWKRM